MSRACFVVAMLVTRERLASGRRSVSWQATNRAQIIFSARGRQYVLNRLTRILENDDGFEKEASNTPGLVAQGPQRYEISGEEKAARPCDRAAAQAVGGRGAAEGLCG